MTEYWICKEDFEKIKSLLSEKLYGDTDGVEYETVILKVIE